MPKTESVMGAVTLTDVARHAGVSIATASKALNGRTDVAPATRQRVLRSADALAFAPNEVARSLIAGRTGTVGLLTSDLEGRFVLPILMGAEDALGAGQINVFLCDARGDSIREQHHLRALINRRVDGIIVVGRSTDPRPSLGDDIPVPVVYAYAPSDSAADLSFTPDNVHGGKIAVDHLVNAGRRRIAHITGEREFRAATDRADGVAAALTAHRLELAQPVGYGEWSEHWGRDATAALLEQRPDIDGIVCGSDQIARGALEALRSAGRLVPNDVSVVSFDNWEVLATQSRPQLTSVDFNLKTLGRLAARAVFSAIDGEDPGAGERHTPVRLITRGSSLSP